MMIGGRSSFQSLRTGRDYPANRSFADTWPTKRSAGPAAYDPAALLAALCVVLLPSARASAQANSDPGFGLGVHAAYTKGVDADAPFFTGGLHARFRLTGGIGAELLVTYRREEYSAEGRPVLLLEQIPVQGSVMAFFLFTRPVQPYLLAGAGYYWVRASGRGESLIEKATDNLFGFHAGAGVDVRAARHITLQADVRMVFLDVGLLGDLEERFGLTRQARFVHARLGVTYHF